MNVDRLRTALCRADGPVRLVGAHDGLSAMLVERLGFEGLWASGLAISSAYGVPDAGLLTMTELHAAAVQMRQASELPIVADVDAGFGDRNVVRRMVRLYESAGVDAVCIEDKQYPKRNSFTDLHVLEDPRVFAARIAAAKDAQRDDGFMVVARHESFIVGMGLQDALERAELSREAGADGILVHSKSRTANEVASFCRQWRDRGHHTPVFVVPTTYNQTTAAELRAAGVSVVIYANQLIRASVQAMQDVLESVRDNGRTAEVEDRMTNVATLFELTGVDQVLDEDLAALAAGPPR
jgi:phosphoenolpyruvate phosphomutase